MGNHCEVWVDFLNQKKEALVLYPLNKNEYANIYKRNKILLFYSKVPVASPNNSLMHMKPNNIF